MEEVWKNIEGYDGKYEISTLGRVRSNYKNTKILKPFINTSGYYVVGLCNNGRKYTISIHRLVAETFIPNPNNYPEVNHKDYNRTNNNINNLEWCDHQYNISYSKDRVIESIKKLHKRSIYQYDNDGKIIKVWNLIMDIYRELHLNSRQITDCCNNKVKTCGNFVWSYYPLSVSEVKCKFLKNKKQVEQLSKDGVIIKEWESIKEASLMLNINAGHISKNCRGIRKSAGNYIWRYKND